MLDRIIGTCVLGVPAALSTFTAVKWWMEFGVREAYPYLATFMALVLWGCTVLMAIEKAE